MDCKQAVSLMHDYLDGDASAHEKLELQNHLQGCAECRMKFKELEQTDMLLYAIRHTAPTASDELTARIMNALPQPKKQMAWLKWIKKHPAITAAALFLVFMFFGTLNFWSQDSQLIVRGTDLDQVVIKGDTVIVPADKSIAGDLTVENGKAQVYGSVNGNVTVIDGSLYQASTAHISGQVKSIDQAMDWVWYKISNLFSDVAYR
ncbi:zf-HC2 domain-containing protein [Paenibacillus sp. JX-17]|uniref:Anti-sigma-W factor RsiW n=1 Tax=Paenibacillus lacisoli TaxID=3064525 RepID=A0ABT9CHI7_9BACL|nr:zf-HC2 domain-containing protein [Paenibacillus sp. JX-17]MDO7908744.1 zf-HC2 domain-containing protein [Paenibacillus sp. JX-17]